MTYKHWLDGLPLEVGRDARGSGGRVDLSLVVQPSGLTTLGYRRPGAPASSEQLLNTYAEAEKAFRAVWERARQYAQEQAPRG